MCGRYYVDDETAREVEKLVRNLDNKMHKTSCASDIYPTDCAMVIQEEQERTVLCNMTWGFPQYQRKGVLFNARTESALEKRTFSDSTRQRRCLIPAKGFYEWDSAKNKISFERPDKEILLLAGIWDYYEPDKRFVILTTEANDSVKRVHSRMPLIIEPNEVNDWLYNEKSLGYLLHKQPLELENIAGYLQERLPFGL